MNRRNLLGGAAGAALLSLLPSPSRSAQKPTAPDARLRTFLDRVFYERLNENPEFATTLGLDTGSRAALRGKLDDRSREAAARALARRKQERAELTRVDRDALSAMARIDYDVVLYQLDRTLAGERFGYGELAGRYTPYVLTHLSGAYRELPTFLDDQHPIKSAADADAYLSRLEGLAVAIGQDGERQREDAGKGVIAPDYVLDRALVLMDTDAGKPAAEHLLVRSLARRLGEAKLSPERVGVAERLIAERVQPALERQRSFVRELRGRAKPDAGVWRLPEGEAYYIAAAEAAITARMSGDEIHRIGLEQVADLTGRIDAILKQQGMSRGSVGERLVALNQRPDQLFANTDAGRAELVALLNRQIAEVYPRLPQAFNRLPKATVEARRVPENIQAGSAGAHYETAPLDGSKPASYFINLRDTFDRPKFGLKTLTYHEAVPGHHMQGSVALESTAIPLIRRRSYFSGYGEGWALYAEQLADELGMYEGDPLGRVGYLQSLLFRATRLVVDSGLHVKRWSREQATDYFIATTGIARGRSQNEIDRYTVWPGQACSYKIGHTIWTRLRDEVKSKQGARFDLRAFHDVLALGAMPLSVLERIVRERA